jgi:hypothetical protein
MKKRYVFGLFILILICGPTELLGSDAWIGSIDASLSYHEMWQIREKMLSHYNALTDSLIAVAKTASCDSSVGLDSPALAIWMLGWLRAERAIPVLLSKLNCTSISGGFEKPDSPALLGFPAAMALARIGTPAVRDVLARIVDAENDHQVMLCVGILTEAEGREVTEYRLSKLADEEIGGSGRSNVEAALRAVQRGIRGTDLWPPE